MADKYTADTNVLVRAAIMDDGIQSPIAADFLTQSESIVIPIMALCELAWVLKSGYHIHNGAVAETIRKLVDAPNVEVDDAAVRAGLSILDAGGDFADGVIAHEGMWMGAKELVTFDRRAMMLLDSRGLPARLLQ